MTEPRVAPRGALLLACALATASVWAQPAVPSAAAASAAERAQKEADRTMYWIRVLASRPGPVKPATTAFTRPSPPAAAVAPAPSRAMAEAKREKALAAPPPTSVAAAPPQAAPAVVGKASIPAQAPASEVPEPVVPAPVIGLDAGASPSTASMPPMPAPMPEVPPPPDEEPDPGLVQVATAQPDFPTAVVRRVRKGNVEVRFEVEPDGKVIDATVVESSHPRLNDAAIEAVKQWRFQPGTRYHTAAVNLKFDIDTE